ncbi:phage Gp37/Gp68 family protein [Helicobacter sp.]|uniref:phage Gp37/Gp68 family protein n=1 Tax=Helicobacter sp. TaxID=218 RepID=UPI00198D5BBC|nr:phage Gp37/Gp68 family protein [Helicobacter sp.]MBD5165372.1 phage Gp37/Gp68 family protein [Helicobacter sp.]
MKSTKIEWTQASWNPTIGCDKVSDGCQNCYAEAMAKRLQAIGNKDYKDGFKFKMLEHRLNEPLKNKKPTLYFVNSMSDLFHKKMQVEFLDRVMQIIRQTPYHQYQILTKRPHRMFEYFEGKKYSENSALNKENKEIFGDGMMRDIPPNVWLGATVESSSIKHRIDWIRNLQANIKWLSCEPLLDDLGELDLRGIDWVVVGGESGFKARAMQESWVWNIQKQCEEQGVAFFFKQWGTWGSDGIKRNKKENGALLGGRLYREYPKFKV